MNIQTLLDRWADPLNMPFKGQLVTPPGEPLCMCAQGQALHYLGDYTVTQLRLITQYEADVATAKLLNISMTHTIMLRRVNDSQPGAPSTVLTHPEMHLGKHAAQVLALWLYFDTPEGGATRSRVFDEVFDVSITSLVANQAAYEAASAAADAEHHVVEGVLGGFVSDAATNEVIGQDRLKAFYFLPKLGFATPADLIK